MLWTKTGEQLSQKSVNGNLNSKKCNQSYNTLKTLLLKLPPLRTEKK